MFLRNVVLARLSLPLIMWYPSKAPNFTKNLVLLVLFMATVDGFTVLGLFTTHIKSHFKFYEKIMKELVNKGHDVHVLSHFESTYHHQRYKDFSVHGGMPSLENNISIKNHYYPNFIDATYVLLKTGYESCASILKHPVAKKLKTTKVKYDIIVAEVFATDCLLPYAFMHKAPIIGVSSTTIMPWADERMGNPDNPAYIPNYFIARSGPMEFLEKFEVTIVNIFSKFWYYFLSTIPAEIRGREIFENVPTLDDIAKNTSVILVNNHFSINEPRPLVPGMVEVGGLHIDQIKTLPGNLSKFMETAKDGVIYISMGTLLDFGTFNREALETFGKVLSARAEKLIIKGKLEDFEGIFPKTKVYISSWLPQIDILCHNKTKLFITHGGILSLQESAHCGVPILGIPFYPNEEINIRNFVNKKAGLILNYDDIQEEILKNILQKLDDTIYIENAARVSKLFRDRPIPPIDLATYWIEYIGKYGGKHLRTKGADLIFFEYYLVDVIVVVVFLNIIMWIVLYYLLQYLQDLFEHAPPPKPKDDK